MNSRTTKTDKNGSKAAAQEERLINQSLHIRDNRPAAATQMKLQRVADSSKQFPLAQPMETKSLVQRKIQLNGKEADLGKLLGKANDMQEKVILANWGWTGTVHNFVKKNDDPGAERKLFDAVAAAKSQVVNPPALYSAANLKFKTKAARRLETL